LTDLHDLLQRAAPLPPEFDADALVHKLVVRKRRRRGLLAVAALTTAATVTIVAVGATRHEATKRPGIAVAPTSSAPAPSTSTPTVTTPDGNQALDAMPRFPSNAVQTRTLPEWIDRVDAAIDGSTLWALGCPGNNEWSCVSAIDVDTGGVRSLPGRPTDPVITRVTAGDGGVFVLSNAYDGSPYHVTRLDPTTGTHVWSVAVPGTSVQGDPKARLRFGAGALWFSQGTHPVVEFSPADGAVVASIATPGYVEDIGSVDFAFGTDDRVWVVGGESGTALIRIDRATKRAEVVADDGPGFSQSLTADGGYVWTTHHTTHQDLVRIDTADGNRLRNLHVPTYDVAAGDGQTWFLGYQPTDKTNDGANHPGVVGRIDPDTGRVMAVADLPIGALDDTTLIVHGGKAYVLDGTTHLLMVVDPGA
jgi:outer membrane protein assembly factor BamB